MGGRRKVTVAVCCVLAIGVSILTASGWREDFDDPSINPNYDAGSPSLYIIEDSCIKAKYAVIGVENQQHCPYFDAFFDTELTLHIKKISGTFPLLEHRVEKYGDPLHSIKIDGNRFLLTNYVDGTQASSSPISTGTYHLHLIYDGSLTLYVNEVEEITLPTSASYTSTDYIRFPVWNTSNVTWLDLIDIHPPENEMTVSIEPDKECYLPGDEAMLTVTVQKQNGDPLTGCTIDETITAPDSSTIDVTWTDNGDGTYTSDLELTQSGTYSIGVIVSREGYKDGEASTEFDVISASAIAEAYKPYMYYYQQGTNAEKFRPTKVEDMLDNSGFWRCIDYPQSPPERMNLKDPPLSAEDIQGYENAPIDYYYLDLLNDESADYKDEMEEKQTDPNRVYARIIIDEYEGEKYVVVQYWFHYLYNDYVNNHEGEWEMIEVLIDYNKFQQNGIETIPEGAAYSRHLGGEYREWNDIETEPDDEIGEETHPVVYVAKGSHAAYFDEGLFGRQPPYFDKTNRGTRLKISKDTLIVDQPWLEFGGNWGYVPGAPKGPKYQGGKWHEPADWGLTVEWYGKKIDFPFFDFSLHCPADLYLTNSEGQITGTKNGEFIHKIPDSYVNSLGEEERYLVPANDIYTVEIHGTGDGTFNFIPEYSSWNEGRVWGYTDIPVTPDTVAYTEMSPTMTEYILEIDHDGDSVIDETVTPKLGLSLSSSNAVQPLRLNTTLQYEIDITNEGDQEETFMVDHELPNEWTGSLSQDTITVGPKETTTLTLSVNVPDVEIKDYEMRVTASSENGLNTFLTLLASAQPELSLSNLSIEYNENEVLLSCDASNRGLLAANNVNVQFYNGKPENANVIDEKVITLASEESKHVAIPWTTEDGIYTIYAVIDPENTISESAEYNNTVFKEFTIDRTPPEANIKFNTETQNIEVIGVDNIDDNVDVSYEEYRETFTGHHGKNKRDKEGEIEDFGVPFNKIKRMRYKTYRLYTLKDDTGNTLEMKMLYLKLRNVLYTKIVELTYNGEHTTPQRNAFGIVSVYRRGELKNLVQHLRIQQEMVNVTYNARQDRSIIVTRDGMEKREGLVLIILGTEKGTLSYILE